MSSMVVLECTTKLKINVWNLKKKTTCTCLQDNILVNKFYYRRYIIGRDARYVSTSIGQLHLQLLRRLVPIMTGNGADNWSATLDITLSLILFFHYVDFDKPHFGENNLKEQWVK